MSKTPDVPETQASPGQSFYQMEASETARAKINLTLHVGKPDDSGYHPLHSLVVFADIGDDLEVELADEFSLKSKGKFAKSLPEADDNLIMKSVKIMAKYNDIPIKLAYILNKKLPIAAGLGGGSADAAAALRLLARANTVSWDEHAESFLPLGADIPVCYLSRTCIMQGYGEDIMPFPGLGTISAVLVNPGVEVSTKEVFGLFDLVGSTSPFELSYGSLLEMARSGRNDLQPIAMRIEPVISDIISVLEAQKGCELARMSGSGATCFGLFSNMKHAKQAVKNIKKSHPDWWCASARLGEQM